MVETAVHACVFETRLQQGFVIGEVLQPLANRETRIECIPFGATQIIGNLGCIELAVACGSAPPWQMGRILRVGWRQVESALKRFGAGAGFG